MNQIQIPSGMRDLLPQEAYAKQQLQRKITDIYASYGYQPLETPLIEFYSTYRNAFSQLKEETLYKFVDESGQILAVRTDMTLPIARVCVSKYANEKPPLRFSYCSNVYKVRQSFAGKRNEVTDCGIELIGMDSKDGDIEVLSCALDVMECFGIDDYTLEIGNSDFFKLACKQCDISAEDAQVLADLIDRKEIPALNEKLHTLALPEKASAFFEQLPLMNGRGALQTARELCFSDELREETENLIRLDEILGRLGYGDKVTYDLGKVPHLDYYTGIIFEGYVKGIGTAVLSGGRYDALLRKLGRDLPAIGFGVKTDSLLDVCEAQMPSVRKLIYPREKAAEALLKARQLRKDGPVELIPSDCEEMEVVL